MSGATGTDGATGAARAAERGRLAAALEEFAGRPEHTAFRQRSEAWAARRRDAIGGSELATVLGLNPYDDVAGMVGKKLGLLPRGGGNLPCLWGTFFEAVVERVVGLDLGTPLWGTDICVPVPPGQPLAGVHANSPDGYAILHLCRRAGGAAWDIVTAAAPRGTTFTASSTGPDDGIPETLRGAPEPGGAPDEERDVAALLEFKCPFSRLPTGGVPPQYAPQVQSGLAVSPAAGVGLFVDAVFRRCRLDELGPGRGWRPHPRDRPWAGALAWGVAAIYGAAPPEGVPAPPVDLGAVDDSALAERLGLGGRAEPGPVCFADGRGGEAGAPAEEGLAAAAAATRPGETLVAVLPWKLFELHYVPVAREPGFLARVAEPVLAAAAALRRVAAAPRPALAYAEYVIDVRGETDDAGADLAALYGEGAGWDAGRTVGAAEGGAQILQGLGGGGADLAALYGEGAGWGTKNGANGAGADLAALYGGPAAR